MNLWYTDKNVETRMGVFVDAVVQDHEATAVRVVYQNPDGDDDMATGVSKRHPEDEFDSELGYELAFWRAVEKIHHRQMRRVNGLIKHKADVADIQRRQRILQAFRGDEEMLKVGHHILNTNPTVIHVRNVAAAVDTTQKTVHEFLGELESMGYDTHPINKYEWIFNC